MFNNSKSVSKNVVSPVIDFLFLGAGSLIVFPLAMFLVPADNLNIQNSSPQFLAWALLLAYFFNFPHFAYSYQLLYGDFKKKITGQTDCELRSLYVFVGIFVPVIMLVVFAAAYGQNNVAVLGYTVNVMFLTVGWHYAKQGFGMLIVVSVYKKIFYSSIERKVLLLNAHLLWIYAWVMFNTGQAEKIYQGIHFTTLGFPKIIETTLFAFICLTTLAIVFLMIKKYQRERVIPPLNGIGAYVASSYMWIILRFGHGFDTPIHPIVFFIPLLHALQYMTIVFKMKHNELLDTQISGKSFVTFIILGFVIGALIFDNIPGALDNMIHYNNEIYGSTWFLFMFWVFINIHHYFIDNVIWRKENHEVKKYLFTR